MVGTLRQLDPGPANRHPAAPVAFGAAGEEGQPEPVDSGRCCKAAGAASEVAAGLSARTPMPGRQQGLDLAGWLCVRQRSASLPAWWSLLAHDDQASL